MVIMRHMVFQKGLATICLGLGLTLPIHAGILSFNALSPEREAAMGIEQFEKLKSEKPIVRSGANYQSVQRVAARLTPVVRVPNARWEFVVFEDSSPNAFALPGGKVGVHTGLFKVVQNEAQLAAVLGHELAHVTARHSGQRITQGVAGATVGAIAGKILENKTGMDERTAQAIAGGAATLRLLKFSRGQELEADQLGALYMARAGYDPNEAVRLWTNFAAYKARAGGSSLPAFLSTHPVDARRIEELKAYMPTALAEYKGGSGNRNAPTIAQSAAPASSPVQASPTATSKPPRAVSLRNLFRRSSRSRE
jgi:metalloendopeptidase OMA1, mitochondrial